LLHPWSRLVGENLALQSGITTPVRSTNNAIARLLLDKLCQLQSTFAKLDILICLYQYICLLSLDQGAS